MTKNDDQTPEEPDGDSQSDNAPSLIERIGEITGSKPKVLLREESAGNRPALKPLPSDERAEAGKYVVHGELGRGGVGTVHRGHDSDLGREVAMKFLHDKYADEPSILHRFVEEAQIGGQLQHPGIVPVYDLGMVDGKPFFTMKLVRGQTLAKTLAERASPASDRRKFLAIFEDICQTMGYAHARGVVHRDLKPANVMIGSFGEVQVVDWGMGKVLQSGGGTDEEGAPEQQPQGGVIETVRSGGHGTQSIMGSVMGTLAYMPPEQARGDVEQMDERSDVFALGAILCEILTGQPPYTGESREMFDMARRGALGEAHARLKSCGAEADLVELALSCLMPKPAARPGSAEEVAKAVQAHLAAAEQRVHEATIRALALKRTQKLGIALTVVIAAGLAVSLWFWNGAKHAASNEREARGLAERATDDALAAEKRARDAQQVAETNLANFNRLAYAVRLETAKTDEQELYPAWPHMAEAMRRWLGEEAEPLHDALAELRSTTGLLEARAVPWSEAERAAAPGLHPSAGQLAHLRQKLAAMERAHAVRSGSAQYQPVTLDRERFPQGPGGLNDLAWPLVDPEREVFGREAEALAMVLAAFARVTDAGQRATVGDTLAWALFANGLDDEAEAVSEEAVATVEASRRMEFEGYLARLQQAIAAASGESGRVALDELVVEVGALELEVRERRDWEFEDDADQFLHTTLRELVRGIEAFKALEMRGVERRLAWADRVEELTITAHRDRWEAARLAILGANGTTASERYAVSPIELKPQVGLVPIGMNPQSKLWEFYHLRSGWDGDESGDAAQLQIPEHAADGQVDMTGSGIVFVLIPGGTFWMGAQSTAPGAPNFDAWAGANEGPVREVEIAPFFVSKYELTRGQWLRMTGSLDELGKRANDAGGFVGDTHPVEQVGHEVCSGMLMQHGLVLPTEAQWERACRATTSTPWSTGPTRDTLEGYVNLLDWTGTNQPPKWPGGESFDDHFKASAPVGMFQPNAFGLHDMHGNVVEWCQDRHSSYEVTPQAGDGLRDPRAASSHHVFRGGCYLNYSRDVRSSVRPPDAPPSRFAILGLRPARQVLP